MKSIRDIAYREGGERGLLDLFIPEGPGPFPVVICLHGGGWRTGDKTQLVGYASLLVAENIAAVCANYRLSGSAPHPAQEEDVVAVVNWIVAEASRTNLDPQRIGLAGSSSGGHLAVLVGIKSSLRHDNRYRIRCMLSVCGVSDIALWLREKPNYTDYVRDFLGGPPDQLQAAERDASPIAHVHADAPPCLAVHGDADMSVPFNQSVLLIAALRRAGATAELCVVSGAGHGAYIRGLQPPEPLGGARRFQDFFHKHLLQ